MSPLFYILSVALGGAGGALFREFLSRELNGRTKFPAGTFTANMLASFLTGVANQKKLSRPQSTFLRLLHSEWDFFLLLRKF